MWCAEALLPVACAACAYRPALNLPQVRNLREVGLVLSPEVQLQAEQSRLNPLDYPHNMEQYHNITPLRWIHLPLHRELQRVFIHLLDPGCGVLLLRGFELLDGRDQRIQ